MKKVAAHIFVYILFFYGLTFSQTIDTSLSDQLIEDILPEPINDLQEYNEINEFELLEENPVNINTANIVSLQKIPGLDFNYALFILKYREKYGYYYSPNELYSIKEIPKYIIKSILPFITTSDPKNKGRTAVVLTGSPSIKAYFKTRSSYDPHEINDTLFKNYPGSKLKLYNKFSFIYNSTEFGFITQKDPGEKSYIDYWSSHLTMRNTGPFEIIILGDYRFESGLGLVLGEPFGFSKTLDVIYPVKKKERLIKPNNSSTENGFYRGAAASLIFNNVKLSGFYSNRFRDASIDSVTQYISGILNSGYHRTNSEINKIDNVHEIKWGIRAEYLYNSLFSVAILYCRSIFNREISNNIPYTYRGNKFEDLSLSYDLHTTSSIYLTGEFAYDFNSIASLNSMQISFNKDFLFFSSIRIYPGKFISLSGQSFAEQSGKVQNEIGFYNGFKLQTGYGLLSLFYDQFKFPFGSYRFPTSNSGEEFMLGYMNSFSDNINIKINYKYENKDYVTTDLDHKYIGRRIRNDLRFNLRWTLSEEINVKSVIEYNSIQMRGDKLTEQGVLLTNSISIGFLNYFKSALSISFFQTGSFYSSVYEYDEFIRGLVMGRVLYGEGLKLNLYFKYQMFPNVGVSIQYSEIYKPEEILINPIYSIITNNLIIQLETHIN